ncbi:PLP-dependent aminotransferase family protein [Rhodanobacter sp. FDAARGOS 1247]|uniref:MocR-like pyridoxine biosynthesis transcription factor PdxR n=1 Tax=Rhodanobacter sp. FDAARGOS 1247 TaxID=2778082 RepID=UPI00194F1CF2|nr:PLP-dependent aminotransferase family protein [Rhodanobacter sp. FDAARGOS 1247]QRP63566.1 PLP-dependent aminotransferase family protein [Rhodanobacter sp. FDAARGOS 1247]
MFLILDGTGPQYAQLSRAMKAAILDGRIGIGSRLAPTRELAQELGLSRTTVLAAYEQLRAEGFIDARVGSGSYVAHLQTTRTARPLERSITPPSRYAHRARRVQDRTIAQLHSGLRYNLQYGNPLVNPALSETWGRELARAAAYTPTSDIRAQGSPALREQVCAYLARHRGVRALPENVLIVSGAQQAFSLTARVLLNEGDPVALEDPHYFGAYQALGAHGARICSVPVDHEGLICEALPVPAPALVCVTPSHQFPSGAVMSLRRRLELLHYADTHKSWVLEDDYDGEFRYDSRPLAALRSLDQGDRVIHVGSFSKTLFGSLRLAYMVLPVALRDDFINAKYLSDFSCPGIEQAALAHFMESGGFERHLRQARKELKGRREELIRGLHRHAGDRVDIVDSPAGMHVVVWLRGYDEAQAQELIELAHSQGLGLYPMAPHYASAQARPGLLLGYCGLSAQELHDAMQLFGHCLDEMEERMALRPARRRCQGG